MRQSTDLIQIPEQIRRLGILRAGTAVYDGRGTLKVDRYEMASDAGALEVEQTWKPQADTVAIHKDSYFTIVHWENTDRGAVAAFVRELEKR